MCIWIVLSQCLWAKAILIPRNNSGATIRFGHFLNDFRYFVGVGHAFRPWGGPKVSILTLVHFFACQSVYVLPSKYQANMVLYPSVDGKICALLYHNLSEFCIEGFCLVYVCMCTHIQPYLAISNHIQPYPTISSHIQPYPTLSSNRPTSQSVCHQHMPPTAINNNT